MSAIMGPGIVEYSVQQKYLAQIAAAMLEREAVHPLPEDARTPEIEHEIAALAAEIEECRQPLAQERAALTVDDASYSDALRLKNRQSAGTLAARMFVARDMISAIDGQIRDKEEEVRRLANERAAIARQRDKDDRNNHASELINEAKTEAARLIESLIEAFPALHSIHAQVGAELERAKLMDDTMNVGRLTTTLFVIEATFRERVLRAIKPDWDYLRRR